MANITTQDAGRMTEISTRGLPPTAAETEEKLQRNVATRESVASTPTFSLKAANAFVQQAKNSNFAVETWREGVLKYGSLAFPADDDYIMDDTMTIDFLKNNKLPMQYFGDIRETHSTDHLEFVKNEISQRELQTRNIPKHLGSTGMVAATLAGSIIDVDLAGGLAIGFATKASTISKLVTTEIGYETALATGRLAIYDDYTAGDVAFDMTIGAVTAIGGGAAVRYFNREKYRAQIDDAARQAELAEFMLEKRTWPEYPNNAKPKDVKPKDADNDLQRQMDESREIVEDFPLNKSDETGVNAAKSFSPTIAVNSIVQRAEGLVGNKYVWGGSCLETGADCSGFTQSIFKESGVNLPRTAWGQAKSKMGTNINYKDMKIGDVIYFKPSKTGKKYAPVTHVGIITDIRDGKYIMTHAKGKKWGTVTEELSPGYKSRFYTAKRYIDKDTKVRASKKRIDSATTSKERRIAVEDHDAAIVDRGRARDRAENVNDILRREAFLEPNRSPNYRTNRTTFFESQRKIQVDNTIKRIDELEKKGITDPQLQKQLDNEMDRLYKDSFDSDDMKFMRMLDEMDSDMTIMRTELSRVREEIGDGTFDSMLKTYADEYPKQTAAINEVLTSPLDDKALNKFVKTMSGYGVSKKKAVTAAMLLGGTSAFAGGDDDSGIGAYVVGGMVLAGMIMLGVPASKVLLDKYGAMDTTAFSNVVSKVKKGMNNSQKRAKKSVSPEASQLQRTAAVVADIMETELTSAAAPFLKAGGDKAKIFSELTYSPSTGAGAQMDRISWTQSAMGRFANYENEAVKQYKLSQGMGVTNGLYNDTKIRTTLRNQMSDDINLMTDPEKFAKLPEFRKDLAKKNNALMKELYDRSTEYEVMGFIDWKNKKGETIKGIEHRDGDLVRYWQSANMYKRINQVDARDEVVANLKNNLADAFNAKIHDPERAKEIADKFVNDWKSGKNIIQSGRARKGDDIYDALEGYLKDDVDMKEVFDALKVPKDRSARAKSRIPLDIESFVPVKATINGDPFEFTIDVLMDRDFKSILDRTANSMNGQSAIAAQGYKTTSSLETAINTATIGDPKLNRQLKQIADLSMGIPVDITSEFLHEIAMIGKNVTTLRKLPYVLTSMPPEVINTIAAGPIMKGIRSLTRSMFDRYGADSNIMHGMQFSGLASNTDRLDWTGFRGYGDMSNDLDDVGASSKIRQGTMKMRDFSLYINGLAPMTDKLQKAGIEINGNRIGQYLINGETGNAGISASRAKQWGFDTPEFQSMFGNTFKLNDKGYLKPFDPNSWGIKKQDAWGRALRLMNQQISPETYIGNTPLYTHTNDLGRGMSGLISFSLMQFNEYGINDLRHLDRAFYAHNFAAVIGGYMGMSARAEIKGQEISEEQKLIYTIMGLPAAQGISAVQGMADPALFDTAKVVTNMLVPEQIERR